MDLSLSESVYAVSASLQRSSLFNSLSHLNRIHPRAATEQGGLLSGVDPTVVNTNDPIRLWIIQVTIIISTAQLLSLLLRKLKQPKVIAEVIGGIVLGPTLMGRVPHFTQHIFPKDSLPFLSLVANIGLVLFLFLVGLEIETDTIRRNAKSSFLISMGGMILPFSIGIGMAKLIFETYVVPFNPNTKFTHFMLFTAVAYSITAFPVLCRILTELKLLDTTVGICVLSAGVGNDIVGWTLLALSVALVNATSGLTALYIVLLAVAWALIIIFPIRRLFALLARKLHPHPSSEPSILFMTITLTFTFGSAFFTDVIGVHAIFGGFLAGLVVPREGGLAIKMTEKIEDLVGIVFLPLYFTLSGLSTNLGLLNTGKIWGYTIAIIITAWFGKFVGATSGARLAGFRWRESSTIGCLMSCKGLVELIVLNVGLQAGILSTLVFSMFVLEALVLTFCTTPSVVFLYPPSARVRVGASADKDREEKGRVVRHGMDDEDREGGRWKRVIVVLDRLEHLSGMLVVGELLRPLGGGFVRPGGSAPTAQTTLVDTNTLEKNAPVNEKDEALTATNSRGTDTTPSRSSLEKDQTLASPSNTISLTALRILELSGRTSAVMKSIMDITAMMMEDPVLRIFKTVSELGGGKNGGKGGVRCVMKVESLEGWATAVKDVEEDAEFDEEDQGDRGRGLVVLCWNGVFGTKHSQTAHDETTVATGAGAGFSYNPFEYFFRQSPMTQTATSTVHSAPGPIMQTSKSESHGHGHGHVTFATPKLHTPSHHHHHHHEDVDTVHTHFIRSVFSTCHSDVALFVDQSGSGVGTGGSHTTIFLPFFGGPDDRIALDMLVWICLNKNSSCSGVDGGVKGVVVRLCRGDMGGEGVTRPEGAHHGTYGHHETVASMGSRAGGNTIPAFPDTVYGHYTTATRLQSQTADELAWERYTSSSSPSFVAPTAGITFDTITTPAPLASVVELAQHHSSGNEKTLILLGRSRRLAVESHHKELKAMLSGDGVGVSSDVRKTLGDVGAAVLAGDVGCDLMVLQAGGHGRGGAAEDD